MEKISIVIPTCYTNSKCEGLLESLLTSIKEGEYDCPIIVAFDNCGEEFVEFFKVKFPFIEAVVNKKNNLGFAANSNRGLRYNAEKYGNNCFLINMDTILPHSRYLLQIAGREGIITPSQIYFENPTLESINKQQPEEVEYKDSIKFAGFCMYISYSTVQKVGYLDEHFISSFEDDDYCIRVKLAGLPVQECNIKVWHYLDRREGISTTGAYDEFILGFNLEHKFKPKWGIPKEIPHAECNSFILEHHVWNEDMRVD